MLKSFLRSLLLLHVLLVGGFGQALAQHIAQTYWYFGSNMNSMQFQRPDFVANQVSIANALGTGGGAVATDPVKGELWFYTDGITVYNAEGQALNAGSPLNGSTTRNQGTLIAYNPADADGDNSEILIFTVNDAGSMSYSVYDNNLSFSSSFPLPADGGMGQINSTTGVPAGPLSEGMVMVPNADKSGFWLVTHNLGTDTYNVTQIDASGIATAAPVSIAGAPTSVANLSYHEGTGRIAVSPGVAGTVQLLNIDAASGALTDSGIDLTSLGAITLYDTEFITSGDTLYLSGSQELVRISLVNIPPVAETVLTLDIQNSYGLQYGPDSMIYHLYEATDGLFKLGRIEEPDTSDINQVTYDPEVFTNVAAGSSINFAARQFPAFLPQYDLIDTPTFLFDAACANVPAFFFHQTPADVDSVLWDFGDGSNSSLIDPIHTFTDEGTYDVTLTIYSNGVSEVSAVVPVTIQAFDLTLSVDPTQQYWCPEDFPVSYTATAQGSAAGSAIIRWSNQTEAEANATTSIEEAGTYYVVATDPATGCEVYVEQQVFEYGEINTYANAWYFGDNAGIDFNPLFDQNDPDFGTIQAIPPGDTEFLGGNLISDAPEGVSIYCDAGGRPILYSDGQSVYNRDNTLLTDALGGSNEATQSVYIMQNPADATLYYIFFTEEVPGGSYEFSYAVFDLKGLNGGGDLVRDGSSNPIITTLHECNTERITGNGNWVITHEFGNNNFRAYPVTALGVGRPVTSNVGRVHEFGTDGRSAQGYMLLDGSRLAVAISLSDNENYIDVFNFDTGSGAVTADYVIDLSPETGQVYGIGLGAENIFATLRNSSGGGTKLLWWDIIDNTQTPPTQNDEATINGSVVVIAEEVGIDMGALQIGPDGVMYIAKDGAGSLASLGTPDAEPATPGDATVFGYTLDAVPDLQGGTSRLGLPNFVDFSGSSAAAPTAFITDGCQGEPVDVIVFNPLQDSDREIENYVVVITDPDGNQTSIALDEENPIAVFDQTQVAGVYEAQFFILNNCNSDVAQSDLFFTINELPQATLVSTTAPTGCGNSDGSALFDITSAGQITYFVTGTVSTASSTVIAPRSNINIPNLSAGVYTINMINDSTGCVNTLDFTLSDPAPYGVNLEELDAANCPEFGGGGALVFSFTGATPFPSVYTATITNTNTNESITLDQDDLKQVLDLDAGNYSIFIDASDGCMVTDVAVINAPQDISITTDMSSYAVCDEDVITIPVTTDGVNPLEVYEIIGGIVSDTQAPNVSISGTDVIIQNPDGGEGVYNYSIVSPGNTDGPCTNSVEISVGFGDSSPSPYNSSFVVCPDELSVERNTVFLDNNPAGFQEVRWFTPGGVEIVQTSASGATNVAGITFSAGGDSLLIQSLRAENIINLGAFRAELTNVVGCITITEIVIMEDCEARVNAPTAFTPNSSSGVNDRFVIFPFLVSEDEFEFFIFNRWGELIFQTQDYNFMVNEGWNGGYDNDAGRPVQGGTYAYKVTFKSEANPEEGTRDQRGSILLIR